jgi:hypothetical protein
MSGGYVPITYFAGTVLTTTDIKWMTNPLGKAFNNNYEIFSETMCKLGGIFCDKKKSGCYTWFLKVLPKIPLQIVYYDADDEFPC